MYFSCRPQSNSCSWVFGTIGISRFYKLLRKLIYYFYRAFYTCVPTRKQLIIKHSITSNF